MKSVSRLLFLLSIGFLSIALQAQEKGFLGLGSFSWGTSLQTVKFFLDQQGIKYKTVDSRTRPGQKLLWANIRLSDEERRFSPLLLEQTFSFDNDSLFNISLKQVLHDKKARTSSYNTFKLILSEQYKSIPEDIYMYKGSSEEVRGCDWKFPTTTIWLQEGPDTVIIIYSARAVTESKKDRRKKN